MMFCICAIIATWAERSGRCTHFFAAAAYLVARFDVFCLSLLLVGAF